MPKLDKKADHLKTLGALNPHPERVIRPDFQSGVFFDPQDLIQVKYEMLRLVMIEGSCKAQAAIQFGMSRQTFYQTEVAYRLSGIAGFLPHQRGPKSAHKLDAQLMVFINSNLASKKPIGASKLARLIRDQFDISVHPRSIERAIAREKNTPRKANLRFPHPCH